MYGDLSTGLIARFPFDGNASDISGNGNHGTVYGAITVADRFGQENQAYFFDGVDDYIDLGNSTSLNPANLITVSAWVSCSSLKYAPVVERYEPHQDSRSFFMTIGSSSSNHSAGFYIYDADSPLNTNSSGAVDDGPLHQNQVYHLVGTYDSSNKNSFYINGILKSQVSAIGSIQQSSEITTIGGVLNNAGKFFHGSIDDIRIYNRALTENEVRAFTPWKIHRFPVLVFSYGWMGRI